MKMGKKKMMTCRELSLLIVSGQELSFWQRIEKVFHLLICRDCTNFNRWMQWLGHVISQHRANLRKPPMSADQLRALQEKVIDTAAKPKK